MFKSKNTESHIYGLALHSLLWLFSTPLQSNGMTAIPKTDEESISFFGVVTNIYYFFVFEYFWKAFHKFWWKLNTIYDFVPKVIYEVTLHALFFFNF